MFGGFLICQWLTVKWNLISILKNFIISEISITPRIAADKDTNLRAPGNAAIKTTFATFQIKNAKF